MKKVFIAYADKKMAYSLQRIGKQARQLGLFDEVALWTPEDLPAYVKESELMKHSYGGGYWAWKPVIIYETLQKYEEGTVVCYIDAGCTLRKHDEWNMFFDIMRDKEFLCFHYKDYMPEWERFGSTSTKIKHWTKKESLHFLDNYIGTGEYRETNKVMGGILFVKGKKNPIIRDWMDISLNHPKVILDPDLSRLDEEYDFFAQHKHDQPVLTALVYKYRNDTVVLQELFVNLNRCGAIEASRIRAKTRLDFVKWRIKRMIRSFINCFMFNRREN